MTIYTYKKEENKFIILNISLRKNLNNNYYPYKIVYIIDLQYLSNFRIYIRSIYNKRRRHMLWRSHCTFFNDIVDFMLRLNRASAGARASLYSYNVLCASTYITITICIYLRAL